ncbi:EAL domain-containing protein [Teredinibacter turnerae]|uniref:EAL domain-containing protein n=1 Tax=Teredinibacter turnerae TaxID=2426 RepID=UPI000423E9DE|nr:EAL domain-containing protein [Teredinibacter turnerae]
MKWPNLLALLLLCVATVCAAQEKYRAYPLYLEEKPRPDLATATVRDAEGFLWIATDNGLKRYDGYKLRVFNHDETNPKSIGTNIATNLLITSAGELWIIGHSLSRYNPDDESFTNFYPFAGRSARDMLEDSQGHLWIAGDAFGLVEFDPQRGEVLNRYFADSERGEIRDLAPSARGDSFWVASSGGVYRMSVTDRIARPFSLPLDFVPGTQTVRAICEDHTGLLWVASDAGLITVNPETGTTRQYHANPAIPGSLATDNLWALYEDASERMWVGTDKEGLQYYRPETDDFAHLPATLFTRNTLPPGSLMNIYEDVERNLWLALGPYGVYRISPDIEKFTNYRHSLEFSNALSFNNILDLLEARDGRIWIATDGGGLNVLEPSTGQFDHYLHDPTDPNSLSSDSVISLAEDSQGRVWVGTWGGGLNAFDPRTNRFTHYVRDPTRADDQTLSSNNIFRILPLDDDRLMLSTWGRGFQIFDPATEHFETHNPYASGDNPSGENYSINDFAISPEGEVWIGGYNGLESYSLSTGKFHPLPQALHSSVFDIHQDTKGDLWLATSENLVRYRPVANTLRSYTPADGLADSFVVSIEEDSNGMLWIGTRNGLSKFDPRSERFENFSEHDGLAGAQFNRNSHLLASTGDMYFGTTNGLNEFDPAHLPVNEHAPPVHFTGLELFQQTVVPGQSPWLQKPLNRTRELVLPYSQRDITFTFTALNLINPEKNRFRYRLFGLEDTWLETDSSGRRVRYTNLAAGHYQFQILSANNEGVWNSSARVINLVILPAWWQTWWAFAGYALLAIFVIYAFSQWRVRTNHMRERELQELVEQQTTQLRYANQRVVQLNSELEQRVVHRTQELSKEIEERRESEARAQYMAYHDTLTGLKNRVWLLDHLRQLIEQGQLPFALLYIGGDRFRRINDSHGHLVGDKLLGEVARRLRRLLPDSGHCVRLGSDEFAVVIDNVSNRSEAVTVANRIIATFQQKFSVDQLQISFGVSIGILFADKQYNEATQLLRNANIAMQRAKERGRGVYQLFDHDVLRTMLDKTLMEVDLRRALSHDELTIAYQPILHLKNHRLRSFEVLLRWHHTQRGNVPTEQFIAVAESIGLIFELGIWVLRKACLQINSWQAEFGLQNTPKIAVNLSPLQMRQADLLSRIDDVFRETGASPDKIRFEITESALMENTDTVDMLLEGLRERGIELAIDDFGTGYSSLSYLDRLPVQQLKIDRAFVTALVHNKNDTGNANEIVRATINLAHTLNMRVVAEGIETEEQRDILASYSCDYGQGYLISAPMDAVEATSYLRSTVIAKLVATDPVN